MIEIIKYNIMFFAFHSEKRSICISKKAVVEIKNPNIGIRNKYINIKATDIITNK